MMKAIFEAMTMVQYDSVTYFKNASELDEKITFFDKNNFIY